MQISCHTHFSRTSGCRDCRHCIDAIFHCIVATSAMSGSGRSSTATIPRSGTDIVLYQGMETIAITDWNGVISPVYDTAQRVVVSDGNTFQTVSLSGLTARQRAECLKSKGVTLLLCGAISVQGRNDLDAQGIRQIAWLAGSVHDAVDAYRQGRKNLSPFIIPACCPQQQRCCRLETSPILKNTHLREDA